MSNAEFLVASIISMIFIGLLVLVVAGIVQDFVWDKRRARARMEHLARLEEARRRHLARMKELTKGSTI